MIKQLAIALPVLALVTAAFAGDDPPETTRETAPYARVFQQDQKWTFNVSREDLVASTSTNEGAAHCKVTEVSTGCDRTVSTVVCDGDAHVLAGTYASNARGMWKVADTDATTHGVLPDTKRTFARFPESFLDDNGETVAQAFNTGWCSTSTENGVTATICIDQNKGFIGGAVTAKGTRTVVGDVPRTRSVRVATR